MRMSVRGGILDQISCALDWGRAVNIGWMRGYWKGHDPCFGVYGLP